MTRVNPDKEITLQLPIWPELEKHTPVVFHQVDGSWYDSRDNTRATVPIENILNDILKKNG